MVLRAGVVVIALMIKIVWRSSEDVVCLLTVELEDSRSSNLKEERGTDQQI